MQLLVPHEIFVREQSHKNDEQMTKKATDQKQNKQGMTYLPITGKRLFGFSKENIHIHKNK